MLKLFFSILFVLLFLAAFAQEKDSVVTKKSGFDRFMERGEVLFRKLPVPLYAYSTEGGHLFGIAKFNLFHLSSKDTISYPSKISGVYSMSTKGRINTSISNEMIFKENKYIVVSFINYKKLPEYIFGIGNDVSAENKEQISQDRFEFSTSWFRKIKGKTYGGVILTVSDYFNIKTDSNSILLTEYPVGLAGGATVGAGLGTVIEKRDNRYNPSKGAFVEVSYTFNFGDYYFRRFFVDMRKYFTPFGNRIVLALQATTTYASGEVPFYELSMLGGDKRMRGYYQGALRDNAAVDAQTELRVPVWKIFGVTAFAGVGQVAPNYKEVSFNNFWVSYGAGLRIRVDSRNNTNLRLDMGFGKGSIKAFNVNFAEAF